MNYIKVQLNKEALSNAIKSMNVNELLTYSYNHPNEVIEYYDLIKASADVPKILNIVKEDFIDNIRAPKLHIHTIQVINSLTRTLYTGNRYYACDEEYLYISNTQPIDISKAIECRIKEAAHVIDMWDKKED